MSNLDVSPTTPLQRIEHELFHEHGVELYIKREDLVHPQISGNKWYKLKYNLQYAKQQGYTRLVSFGGAFSNHLHALAYAGQSWVLRPWVLCVANALSPLIRPLPMPSSGVCVSSF